MKLNISNLINLINKVNIYLKEEFKDTIDINGLSNYINEIDRINTLDETYIMQLLKQNQLWIDYFNEKDVFLNYVLDKYLNVLSMYEEIDAYLSNETINPHVFSLITRSKLDTSSIYATKDDVKNKITKTKLKIKQIKVLSKYLQGYIKYFYMKNIEMQKTFNIFKFKYWNSTI